MWQRYTAAPMASAADLALAQALPLPWVASFCTLQVDALAFCNCTESRQSAQGMAWLLQAGGPAHRGVLDEQQRRVPLASPPGYWAQNALPAAGLHAELSPCLAGQRLLPASRREHVVPVPASPSDT